MKFNFKKFRKIEYFILLLILVLGASLRLPGVLTNSFAFTFDVGRDLLAIAKIVYEFDIALIGPTTGIQVVFFGPWWYYMLTPFFIIFNGNPQGIALTMSVIGTICIFLVFILGRKVGNNFLGLSSAFLTAISPSLVSSSVQIWNPNIIPILVLLSFLLLQRIYVLRNKTSPKLFFVLGLILALGADLEIMWGTLFLLAVSISLVVILKKNFLLKHISYYILGIFFVLLPRIAFELRHSFLMTKSFITFLFSKNAEDKLDLYHFLENRVNIHLENFTQSFMPESTLALVFILTILIVIVLFYKNSSKIVKNFILTSFITISVFYLGTIIFARAIWPHYLVGLPVIYIFLFSLCLYTLSIKFRSRLWSLALVAIIALNFNSLTSFRNNSWEGNASVYRNQLNVIDYVYTQAKGEEFKYVVYTPPVFDHTYRYLFNWYGPKKYKYNPTEDARIAYFIIEPDPGYPDRPKWWLNDRKNDGKIIKEEVLKGGIVVQTRIH